MRAALKPIKTNYKQFFKGQGAGLPRFHGKYQTEPSFASDKDTAKIRNHHLYIAKIGWMKLTRSGGFNPHPEGKFVSGRIRHECGKWWAYFTYEVDLPQNPSSAVVGIDFNVGQMTLSSGQVFRTPDTARYEARKHRYQRIMAHRDQGCRKTRCAPSARYCLARERMCKAARKIHQICVQ